MPANSTDTDYESAFTARILPAIDDFKPDIVLVSAGFDAHRNDPLAQVCLSTNMYQWMTARLMEVADRHAGGRLSAHTIGYWNGTNHQHVRMPQSP